MYLARNSTEFLDKQIGCRKRLSYMQEGQMFQNICQGVGAKCQREIHSLDSNDKRNILISKKSTLEETSVKRKRKINEMQEPRTYICPIKRHNDIQDTSYRVSASFLNCSSPFSRSIDAASKCKEDVSRKSIDTDVEGWCRTCATKQSDIILMLGQTGIKLNLLSKLNTLIGTMEGTDTVLPMQMCRECILRLDKSLEFIEQIKTAENSLKAIICSYGFVNKNIEGIETVKSISKLVHNLVADESKDKAENTLIEAIQCDFCFASFKSKQLAKEHETFHDETTFSFNAQFTCEYCLKLFQTNNKLRVHMLVHSNQKSGILCESCGKLCTTQIDHWKHCLVDHPREGPLECLFCKEIYPSESKLQFHIQNVHPETLETTEVRKHRCDTCGIFIFAECLASHAKWHEVSLQFKCEECRIFVDNRIQIEKHIAFHTHVCPRCDKRFTSNANLQAHLTKHEMGLYPCYQYGEAFYSSSSLERHQSLHEKGCKNRNTYACKFCSESFAQGISLLEHQKAHTRAERDDYFRKLIQCELCQQCFISEENYSIHVMIKHKVYLNELKCILCGKINSDRKELLSHMQEHKQILRHKNKVRSRVKCDYCDLTVTREALRSHVNYVHSNDPNAFYYVCHLCGQRIKRIDNFRTHMRVHNDEKPFRCKYCSSEFVHNSKREMHMRNDHPEYLKRDICHRATLKKKGKTDQSEAQCKKLRIEQHNSKCRECNEVYSSYSRLRTHVIKAHPLSDLAHFYKAAIWRKKQALKDSGHKCNVCNVVFRTYDSRRLHVVKKHPDSDKAKVYSKAIDKIKKLRKIYKHKCKLCNIEFASHYLRKAHVIEKHPSSEKAFEYKSNDLHKCLKTEDGSCIG